MCQDVTRTRGVVNTHIKNINYINVKVTSITSGYETSITIQHTYGILNFISCVHNTLFKHVRKGTVPCYHCRVGITLF